MTEYSTAQYDPVQSQYSPSAVPAQSQSGFYSHPESVLEPLQTPRDRRSHHLGDVDSGCYVASSGCRPQAESYRGDPVTAAGREEHHGKWSPDVLRPTSEREEERDKKRRGNKERGRGRRRGREEVLYSLVERDDDEDDEDAAALPVQPVGVGEACRG